MLGNDTPHDNVPWSKTPSFCGIQDNFGVLLTTKRGCFCPQIIVMWGIISQQYHGFENLSGVFRPIGAMCMAILFFSKNPTFLISPKMDLGSLDVEEPWYMCQYACRIQML